jgi:PAS domain S-box-containing protein
MVPETQFYVETLEKKIAALELENRILKENKFSILRSLPEIVFIFDTNERLIFLNNTCLKKFGLEEEVLCKSIKLKDLITPGSWFNVHKEYLKDGKKDTIHAPDIKGIRKDGSYFTFTAYFTKFKDNDLSGYIGIGFDVTDRVEIENQLKEANLAKMKFFSIIAHDLRNPFNSLLGFSTLLLANYDKYSDDKIREYLQYMSKAANHGHQLLENLLNWARANSRKIEFNPETFNLYEVVNETAGLMAGAASKKEINISVEVPESIHVYADQNMIQTVVRNILSNSIKFTPRKGLVKITASEKSGNAVVEIIDNGIGISQDKIPGLFSLSSDYSTLGTEKETGTGLGLILCYEFMQVNHGKIEAESSVGNGSIFRITIPLQNSL